MQIPGLRVTALAALLAMTTFAYAATPRLVQALRSGDRTAALDLSRQHDEAIAVEGDGTTALHWAAHWANLDALDLLLKAGANPMAANRLGATPMFIAAEAGSAGAVGSAPMLVSPRQRAAELRTESRAE